MCILHTLSLSICIFSDGDLEELSICAIEGKKYTDSEQDHLMQLAFGFSPAIVNYMHEFAKAEGRSKRGLYKLLNGIALFYHCYGIVFCIKVMIFILLIQNGTQVNWRMSPAWMSVVASVWLQC